MSLIQIAKNLLRPLDYKIGRLTAQVNQQATRLIRGKLDWKHNCNTFKSPNKIAQKTAQFRRDGVLMCETVTEEKVDAIAQKFDTIIRSGIGVHIRAQDNSGNPLSLTLKEPMRALPEFSELITRDIRNSIESYYNSYFTITSVFAWRNLPIPEQLQKERELYSSYWHYDQYKSTMLKLFVYLTDVNVTDGPFHYFTKPDSKKIVKSGFKGRDNNKNLKHTQRFKEYERQLLGKRGTTALVDTTTCLHRAGVPSSNSQRDICQFVIFPSKTPLPEKWWETLELTESRNFRRGK